MKTVVLNASGWQTKDDFYDAFFKAVGAPEWHGRNFNALNDSIAGGLINAVEVPYTIVVKNSQMVKGEAEKILQDFRGLIEELAQDNCEIAIRLE